MDLTDLGKMSDAELEQFRRPLVYVPNPILREPSVNVEKHLFDSDELKLQIACQYATMRLNGGVGMAAVQMSYEFADNKPNRVIVFELPDEGPKWLINPQIVGTSVETIDFEEGCLSVPTVFYNRTRRKLINVVTSNISGQTFAAAFKEFGAVLIQHELDHLDGIVFTDAMSALKRGRARMKVSKYLKRREFS